MAMTRKNYEKIAKTILKYKYDIEEDAYVDFIHELCVIFEEDNDRFNADTFKKATKLIWIILKKH